MHDRWLRGEAARHDVVVTRAELRRAQAAVLRRSGRVSPADARMKARAAVYATRLREHAAAGDEPSALTAFTSAWRAWWQPQTHCAPAYFVADVCAAPGGPLKALTPRPRLSLPS